MPWKTHSAGAMTTKSHGLTFAFIVSLAYAAISACDRSPSDPPSTLATPKAAPPKETVVEKAVKVERAEVPTSRTQARPTAPHPAGSSDEDQRRQPLDLSIPQGIFESITQRSEATTPENDDPLGLFAGDEEAPPLKIRGRLWLDREKELSLDSLDGGQIVIEVPTE